jgi:hypothetical protein
MWSSVHVISPWLGELQQANDSNTKHARLRIIAPPIDQADVSSDKNFLSLYGRNSVDRIEALLRIIKFESPITKLWRG